MYESDKVAIFDTTAPLGYDINSSIGNIAGNIQYLDIPTNLSIRSSYLPHYFAIQFHLKLSYAGKIYVFASRMFTDDALADCQQGPIPLTIMSALYDDFWTAFMKIANTQHSAIASIFKSRLGSVLGEAVKPGWYNSGNLDYENVHATNIYSTSIDIASDPQTASINGTSISSLSRNLPAAKELIQSPCRPGEPGEAPCGRSTDFVFNIIIHLNDYHRWSRDRIADWIDELHDKGIINAEFQSWEEEAEKDESEKNMLLEKMSWGKDPDWGVKAMKGII